MNKRALLITIVTVGLLAIGLIAGAVISQTSSQDDAPSAREHISAPAPRSDPTLSAAASKQPAAAQSENRRGMSNVLIVSMKEDGYEPNTLTIKKGDTVSFVNASSSSRWPASNIHPTHDIYPEFDPKREMKPGETWEFTFDKVGQWRMHDHILPYMKGTITVE